jgi:hypothetical protein
MGDLIVEENVYGDDGTGRRRLLYAAGDRISEEEAKRLGVGSKAKPKAADKASTPPADKGGTVASTSTRKSS